MQETPVLSASSGSGQPLPVSRPSGATVLVVDDDLGVRRVVRERLSREGWHVLEAASAAAALERRVGTVDLVLVSGRLPDGDGLTVLRQIKDVHPDTLMILMGADLTVETVVEAVKRGAFHCVAKPLDVDEVARLIASALDAHRGEPVPPTCPGRRDGCAAIVGQSPAVREAMALVMRVAASPASTVLLTGETGTGKGLAARAIHDRSARAGRRFVNITCSTIPEPLIESELFGHERGAFTDASCRKCGLFEVADGGTVFLDEVGDMPLGMQGRLLQFLEERTFRRVGGLHDIHVDVRVITATSRDLPSAVRDGSFREDLFYRLRVMPIHLVPLRERRDDIALLVHHFVDDFNREFGKTVRGVSPEALELLENHAWPGNIRELRNVIERAMLLADSEWLQPGDLCFASPVTAMPFTLPSNGVNLADVERGLLMQALERTFDNQTQAAHLLGINRDQVRYRMEKFGLRRRKPGAERAPQQPDDEVAGDGRGRYTATRAEPSRGPAS